MLKIGLNLFFSMVLGKKPGGGDGGGVGAPDDDDNYSAIAAL